ncbi:beta-1,6-N-acetylglucosaminyltransferase [Jeongeupia sp. USM3]|uniref:beta-1,6-N-acetylglucosaminyltransferase n=1 Tax=Jeongeupia sp. USM3 TaxID=1906741 RepID=UPI00089DF90E|nr:beta-1,6-N-acetylglucosaminyltransferase [Jeongeupia sp. USM3]AOY00643.1 hypothetical protein BJP62_09475 [Jeongeupia sp. USM3]
MRLAYLILAHAAPAQLARLIGRLAAPGVRVYVHVDANTPADVFAEMQALAPAGTVFIARRPCRWGGFSLVDATLDLMRAARADGCDWLVLLSGADYPIKPHADIVARLEQGDVAGYLDLRSEAEFDVCYRWQAWHPESLNGRPAGRALQKLQRGLRRLGVRRRLPAPLAAVWAGSQWWCLRHDAADAVLNYCHEYPRTVAFFRCTLVPDEMFVQTVLMHTGLAGRLVRDPLRHLVWAPGAWSPATLTESDLPALLASDALFARKFAGDGVLTTQLDAALNARATTI